MKYVVVQAPDGEAPVLFPRAFMHSWVAGQLKPMEVVSAGFARTDGGRLLCYGKSESLKIAARPDRDSSLLRQALQGGTADGS